MVSCNGSNELPWSSEALARDESESGSTSVVAPSSSSGIESIPDVELRDKGSVSNSEGSAAGEGESGRGIDDGDNGSLIPVARMGTGDGLPDGVGVVVLEASPIAKLARSRSSRFSFCLDPLSGELALLDPGDDGLGLPVRRGANDFRKLDRALSANSLEEMD